MPTGTVKIFNPDRNFGFVTNEEGQDIYVHADYVEGGTLNPGDVVEFEVAEGDSGETAATKVKVVKAAPADTPVGRTMAAPPTWDTLEERDRQRRAARAEAVVPGTRTDGGCAQDALELAGIPAAFRSRRPSAR